MLITTCGTLFLILNNLNSSMFEHKNKFMLWNNKTFMHAYANYNVQYFFPRYGPLNQTSTKPHTHTHTHIRVHYNTPQPLCDFGILTWVRVAGEQMTGFHSSLSLRGWKRARQRKVNNYSEMPLKTQTKNTFRRTGDLSILSLPLSVFVFMMISLSPITELLLGLSKFSCSLMLRAEKDGERERESSVFGMFSKRTHQKSPGVKRTPAGRRTGNPLRHKPLSLLL